MIYAFEDYLLDTGRRELRRGQILLPVEPKVFDLLQHLIIIIAGLSAKTISSPQCGAGALFPSRRSLPASTWRGRPLVTPEKHSA